MKVLLAAVNAKYIHSNLAVYSLRAYAQEYCGETEIAEYTINQTIDDILTDIYLRQPDVLCLSCYLWNIPYVGQIAAEVPKIIRSYGPEVLKCPMTRRMPCGDIPAWQASCAGRGKLPSWS